MRQLRPRSVLAGAVYALVISGVAGIAQANVAGGAWRGGLFVVVVFGFFFGGFVAGRGNFGSAARHGAAAAGVAVAVFQGLALLRRLFVGQDISLVALVYNVLFAAVCGALGGLLATRSPGADAIRRVSGRDPEGGETPASG